MLGPGIFSNMNRPCSGKVQHDLLDASSDNSPPELDYDIFETSHSHIMKQLPDRGFIYKLVYLGDY